MPSNPANSAKNNPPPAPAPAPKKGKNQTKRARIIDVHTRETRIFTRKPAAKKRSTLPSLRTTKTQLKKRKLLYAILAIGALFVLLLLLMTGLSRHNNHLPSADTMVVSPAVCTPNAPPAVATTLVTTPPATGGPDSVSAPITANRHQVEVEAERPTAVFNITSVNVENSPGASVNTATGGDAHQEIRGWTDNPPTRKVDIGAQPTTFLQPGENVECDIPPYSTISPRATEQIPPGAVELEPVHPYSYDPVCDNSGCGSIRMRVAPWYRGPAIGIYFNSRPAGQRCEVRGFDLRDNQRRNGNDRGDRGLGQRRYDGGRRSWR